MRKTTETMKTTMKAPMLKPLDVRNFDPKRREMERRIVELDRHRKTLPSMSKERLEVAAEIGHKIALLRAYDIAQGMN